VFDELWASQPQQPFSVTVRDPLLIGGAHRELIQEGTHHLVVIC
jgi:hypothetical protein